MAVALAFVKEVSFLRESGFPNTAHRGAEMPAGSDSLPKEVKLQNLEESFLPQLQFQPQQPSVAGKMAQKAQLIHFTARLKQMQVTLVCAVMLGNVGADMVAGLLHL